MTEEIKITSYAPLIFLKKILILGENWSLESIIDLKNCLSSEETVWVIEKA